MGPRFNRTAARNLDGQPGSLVRSTEGTDQFSSHGMGVALGGDDAVGEVQFLGRARLCSAWDGLSHVLRALFAMRGIAGVKYCDCWWIHAEDFLRCPGPPHRISSFGLLLTTRR